MVGVCITAFFRLSSLVGFAPDWQLQIEMSVKE